MLNVVGKNLQVTVPVSALKKMGHIEGTESIQAFFDRIVSRFDGVITDEQKKQQLAEYQPYLANTTFLPIIVTNMLEEDMNFSDAMKASESEIFMSCLHARAIFGMMDIIPGASQMFESVIGEIIDALSGVETQNTSDTNIFSCQIKEVPASVCVALAKLGILDIAEKISKMEKVSTALQEKLVNPVLDAAIKTVLIQEKISEDELDENDKAEIKLAICMASGDVSTIWPVQTILSTVLTKAIDDDITMAEAMATFDADQLVESTVEKIVFSDSLAKYAEQLEKVMATAYKLA